MLDMYYRIRDNSIAVTMRGKQGRDEMTDWNAIELRVRIVLELLAGAFLIWIAHGVLR